MKTFFSSLGLVLAALVIWAGCDALFTPNNDDGLSGGDMGPQHAEQTVFRFPAGAMDNSRGSKAIDWNALRNNIDMARLRAVTNEAEQLLQPFLELIANRWRYRLR